MRFGSVCSGIEAASVAWGPLGWTAAWFSEIEPFPCAVLKHHYPDVPNLGDMTALPAMIRSGQVEVPDLLCGGTPCQAFSVAGLRQSLADERGNLSLTFCEIADAIDEQRKSIIFWENVPGVLSTKDNAFGCFLGALAGENDALIAPGGRWANAGFVDGPKRAVAWRVLDAQYFGVAQRRRRVFVVASARADFDPAAVLFEFEGVRRDTAPSREAGKVAPTIPSRSTAGGGLGTDFDCDGGVIARSTFCIKGAAIGRKPEAGPQHGEVLEDVVYTQNCVEQHAVAYSIALQDVTPREKAQNGKGWNDDGTAYTVDTAATQGVLAPTLTASNDPSRSPQSSEITAQVAAVVQATVAVGTDCYNGAITGDVAATMGTPGSSINASGPTVMTGMQVRRLTPVECERLQGFPDNYTNIKDKCPDGPRYKALGNSWAVPVVRWIGERIERSLG